MLMHQYVDVVQSRFDAGEEEEEEEEKEETEPTEAGERQVEWQNGELIVSFHVGSVGNNAASVEAAKEAAEEVAETTEAAELRDTLSRDTQTEIEAKAEIESTTEFKDLLVGEEVAEPVPTIPVQAKARRGRKKIATQSTK